MYQFNFSDMSEIVYPLEFQGLTPAQISQKFENNEDFGLDLCDIRCYVMSNECTPETETLFSIIKQFVGMGYSEEEIDDIVLCTQKACERIDLFSSDMYTLKIKDVMTNFYNG